MESNHPIVGLPRPAGFEDRIGHRPGAAPGRSVEARGEGERRGMDENKGEWAEVADEGIVAEDRRGPDPELGSEVVGQEAVSDAPATDEGIDASAGDRADATTDGGAEPPGDAEP